MNAAEHFEWARDRAREYVSLGDGPSAIGSFISDLSKHEGTRNIIDDTLAMLAMGEVLLGGAEGAKRFIEGFPVPAVES